MKALFVLLAWRCSRWLVCGMALLAVWACTSRTLGTPHSEPQQVVQTKVTQSQNRQLDLLFVVDDSPSMDKLQKKMAAQLPTFMSRLASIDGGLPDLHVAVVSSSLAAGAFSDVPGCELGLPPGDDGGRFQHKDGCGLNAGSTFIKASPDGKNFTGAIEDVFACIAKLGQNGCGFEHQFESMRQALEKARSNDADNGGFLREDAFLGIVMLTNEDDCSAPFDSTLFDPGVDSVSSPLGALWSYRCSEFGHKCDQPLPHTAPATPVTLTGCLSKEDTAGVHHLTPVSDFVAYLNSLKPDPNKLFVAVIGGPDKPYVVKARTGKDQPEIAHSCVVPATAAEEETYADPGIRLLKFVEDLSGVFRSICDATFERAMTQIADALNARLAPACIAGTFAQRSPTDATPDCNVVLRTVGKDASNGSDKTLPFCDATNSNASTDTPCWKFEVNAKVCPNSQSLRLCYDQACQTRPTTTAVTQALVSCALDLSKP